MPSPIETHTTITVKLSREKRATYQALADQVAGGNISEWLRSIADRHVADQAEADRATGSVRKVRTRVVSARVPDTSATSVRPFPQ